jgi:uncharacterized protein YciU (UPF0263 family)
LLSMAKPIWVQTSEQYCCSSSFGASRWQSLQNKSFKIHMPIYHEHYLGLAFHEDDSQEDILCRLLYTVTRF